jgi:molybdate transport system ATP-binding protein
VAEIVGVETVVAGCVIENTNGLVTVKVNGVLLKGLGDVAVGTDVFVCIRAEDVVLEQGVPSVSSARNHVPGTVVRIAPLGPTARVTLNCGFLLTADVTRTALGELDLHEGVALEAAIKAGAVHFVPRSTARLH